MEEQPCSISHGKYFHYGTNLIGATHVDGAKQNDLPLLMDEESTEDWAKTKHRHIYSHHVHHKTSKDIGKVNIKSIRLASGTDSRHDRNGYRNIKAIEGLLQHPTHGQTRLDQSHFLIGLCEYRLPDTSKRRSSFSYI